MRLALIVATSANSVIGYQNKMPWHLPADLQYFKKITLGKPVIMGRKTFESIGKPLPGRPNIVVTRQKNWRADGVQCSPSLDEAIALADGLALNARVEEVMVIGGAQIYNEALLKAQRIYLTRIHAELVGDAFFPSLCAEEWNEVAREDFGADQRNPYNYSFCVLDRHTG